MYYSYDSLTIISGRRVVSAIREDDRYSDVDEYDLIKACGSMDDSFEILYHGRPYSPETDGYSS